MIIKRVYPQDFEAIAKGAKVFEMFMGDEDIKVGDEILIKEWSPEKGDTGRAMKKKAISVVEMDLKKYFSIYLANKKNILIVEI